MRPMHEFTKVVLISLMAWVGPAPADEQPIVLQPGKGFRLGFPELPASLFAMNVNPELETMCFVRLPDDYAESKQFPMLVYLAGGWGGHGDNAEFPRNVIGPNDYIAVNFPLFRKPGFDRTSYLGGMVVGFDDYEAISSAYRVMLKRLDETIPNIDHGRSFIMGHSNGAKSIAVLLSAMEPTILDAFRGFVMVDGGFRWTGYCRTSELSRHRILYICGGGSQGDDDIGRHFIGTWCKSKQHFADSNGITNWQFKLVPDVGHEFSPKYHQIIRDWAAKL